MTGIITLDMLPVGSTAEIDSLEGEDLMAQRLRDLGFVPGAAAKCLYRSAAGDPTAYRVRGTVIALRRTLSRTVHVIPNEGEDHNAL